MKIPEGYALVPLEPTKEMIKSTDKAMESVTGAISVAYLHGYNVKWQDEHPPMYHAYKAMVARATKSDEIETHEDN